MAPIEESGAFWVFDPYSKIWSELKPNDPQSPYPAGRSFHALTSNGQDTIFLHAGCPEKGRLGDLWAFSIPTRQWRQLTSAPKPERGGTSIAFAEGRIFRMNGFDGNTEQGGSLDVFDPEKNVWDTMSFSADGISGPPARSVSCLLALKVAGRPSLVTMFGEHDPSSLGHQGAGKMLADVWIFDLESEQWAEVKMRDGNDVPQGRGWFDADVVAGPPCPPLTQIIPSPRESVGTIPVAKLAAGEEKESCDETKPTCKACARLSLECSYGLNYTFRHTSNAQTTISGTLNVPTKAVTRKDHIEISNHVSESSGLKLPATLDTIDNVESMYLSHFQSHVRYLLPAASPQVIDNALQSPPARFAILCIAASNLSMLNASVQSRILPSNNRGSIFSPLVDKRHYSNARKYHDRALYCCRTTDPEEAKHQSVAILTTHVLLAYYHHASTDHRSFRMAVGESIRFVLQNRTSIADSIDGARALQLWYRLCTSHRPAKSPALLLEGEGASPYNLNVLPDVTEHLYLRCIVGMSADDLIYDILIKTLEIRTKLVTFRAVADTLQISDQSSHISSLTHEILNKMLGRHSAPHENAEAQGGFVGSHHLLGLLEVQSERLKVWKSRLNPNQLPMEYYPPHEPSADSLSCTAQSFSTHRDAMNALYYMLCQLAIHTSCQTSPTADCRSVYDPSTTLIDNMAHSVCRIASNLSFKASTTSDIYTFSLGEVLLHLVFLWRSDALFHSILDILWPSFEKSGRGYEHSHYPTQLAKRIIAQVALYWENNRVVLLALPAVAENISKSKLLDTSHPIDMVACGYNVDGKYFLEKGPLP
ncbi:hypothetical protein FE257_004470 [Aspergillus nanangensis]|uniref:Uncharacterized protein n=1 Tax=Aspergillus nanangensis TaxID=2582783 RepID=A0AAD4CY58_ASPNN|nr:hypothetical protein FE257_004470 [Aspergillus nanangensis]